MPYVSIIDRHGNPEYWGDADILCGTIEAARTVAEREVQGALDVFIGIDTVHPISPDKWVLTGPAGTVTIIVVSES